MLASSRDQGLRVLCVVGSAPQFNELMDAVAALEQVGPVLCRFAFSDGFRPSAAQRQRLLDRGFTTDGSDAEDHRAVPSARSNWRARIRGLLKALPAPLMRTCVEAFRIAAYGQALAIPYWFLRYGRHLADCRRDLADTVPSVILLAVDFVTYGTGAWIRAAREAGIPSVLVPFAMADRHTLLTERRPMPAYWVVGPTSRYLASRYPDWCAVEQGRRVIALPAAQAIAKQWAGTIETLPWTYNDSRADLTLVESQHALEQLVGDGARNERVQITGRLAHDRLAIAAAGAAEQRALLVRDLGLDPSLPLVVASVTPDKFDVYGAQTEFTSYQDMLKSWATTMMEPVRCNVLASVHPSQPFESVSFIERPGFVLTRLPLADILPMADLFVVDCSATSRLAAAGGIPVLDFDLYGFDLKFNQTGAGLVHVKTRAQFEVAWRRIWEEPGHLEKLTEAQRQNAAAFGLLDGGAGRRIAEAIMSFRPNKEVDAGL